MKQQNWAIWTLIVVFVGCTTQPSKPLVPSGTQGAAATSSVTEAATQTESSVKKVELIEATWIDLQALIRDHSGKVVVVDVWSTACEPCMKEFPHLVAIRKQDPENVVAISFDVDFAGIKNKPPSYYRERVLKFLGTQQENDVLHRMSTTAADDLFTEIELDSIPAIDVYGRDGQLVKRFHGTSEGETYKQHIIPLVRELVEEENRK